MRAVISGTGTHMTSQPNQPRSDEADPESETTPAGVTRDLERKAEETGASTGPPAETPDPDSPGAAIDDPNPPEPNEPG
jgi:hypothetical protein